MWRLQVYKKRSVPGLEMGLTILLYQTPIVSNVEVRQRAVNMGAYLLSCFRGAENPDDRDFGNNPLLVGAVDCREGGIECSRSCLVVVDAVESDAKEVH